MGHNGRDLSSKNYAFQIVASSAFASCARPCRCSCHSPKYVQTTRLLRPFIGILLCSYNGAFSFRHGARNDPRCKSQGSRSFRATYTFPPWLSERALSLNAAFTPSLGYGAFFSLRMPRFLDDYAPVWHSLAQQKLEEIKDMIKRGQRSAYDIGPGGDTLLHVCPLPPFCRA